MLGLGWSEMMIIGVVALIVIGPKDLPAVMGRIGKVLGQVKRMGNDFQREINKTTGLEEIRSLRSSITDPLKKTTDEIRKEFNALTPDGVKPSGAIKPADPKAESVVDEIRTAAGMSAPAAVTPLKANPAPKKAPAKARAVRNSKVAASDLGAVATAPSADAPKPNTKPTRSMAAKSKASAATPVSRKVVAKKAETAPKKPTEPRKAVAKKPVAAKSGVKTAKTATAAPNNDAKAGDA